MLATTVEATFSFNELSLLKSSVNILEADLVFTVTPLIQSFKVELIEESSAT